MLESYSSAYLLLFKTNTNKLLILSCLSDFVSLCAHFNIWSDRSISQVWKIVGRYNLVYNVN